MEEPVLHEDETFIRSLFSFKTTNNIGETAKIRACLMYNKSENKEAVVINKTWITPKKIKSKKSVRSGKKYHVYADIISMKLSSLVAVAEYSRFINYKIKSKHFNLTP